MSARRHLGAAAKSPALLGALLGVALLARVWAAPTASLAGAEFLDAMGTQWFYAYPGWALDGRTGWASTELLFHPWGKEVFLHTGGNLLDAVLAMPLRAVFGPILGYNLFLVALCAFNAFAAARFAAAWGLRRPAQLVAAALFVLAPYHLYELEWGRPTQALTGFIPLALALLRERRGASAGVCIALAGWTYWYGGIVLGFAAAALLIVELREPGRRATLRAWGVAAAVSLALVAPAAVPMLAALDAGQVPGLLTVADGGLATQTEQGDVQGQFALNVLGQLRVETPDGFAETHRLVPPLALVFVLAGAAALGRRALGPLVVVLVGATLAVGPAFRAGELWLDNPAYLALVEHVDLFRRWWWPVRATVLVVLGAAVLAGGALQRLRHGPWLGLPLAVAWCWGSAPLSAWDADPGDALRCLADAPDGAVIDLPLVKDQRHLWDQVTHDKPQLGGMLSRKADFGAGEVDAWLDRNAFAEDLVQVGAGDYTRSAEERPGRQELLDLGYRYLVVRVRAYERPTSDGGVRSDYARLERALSNRLGPPATKDDGHDNAVAVWTLDGSSLSCR